MCANDEKIRNPLVILRKSCYTVNILLWKGLPELREYIGTRCVVCSEKFTEEDDVVICPDCGTPYHKGCYKKDTGCVNTALHQMGGSWKPSYDVGSTEVEADNKVCRFCGYPNPSEALFCLKCGMPAADFYNINNMNAEQRYNGVNINDDPSAYNGNANSGLPFNPFLINFSDPLCGFDPEEDMEGVKMSELGDFVGTNTHYYLPIFKRFKETGRQLSWNFSAMLFPELYFSYRKMALPALGTLLIRFFSWIPRLIVLSQFGNFGRISELAQMFNINSSAFQSVIMICSMASYALMFTAGLYGNKMYYHFARRKISRIKEYSDETVLRYLLGRRGGTSALLMVLFICLMALPAAAMWVSYMFSIMFR